MRILEYKMYYEPEAAASMYLDVNTAEDFAAYGFDVELFTPTPTRGVTKEQIKNAKRKEKKINDRLVIHRYHMYQEGHNIIQRALRYLLCSVVQLWKGITAKDIDVIFAGSTPPVQGAICGIIKKIRKVPFVYNLQDVFPDSMVEAGLTHEGSFIWKIGRKIEDFSYKNADKIIVISENCKSNLINKGVNADKLELIYNWVNENDIVPIDRGDNKLFSELGLDANKFYIVYAGNLGHAQDIDVILNAAELLKENEDIQFLIFGKGAQEDEYKSTVAAKELDNVRFYPLQPYERISEVYSIGDACVVSCKAGFSRSAMPSKTWSIMSCGRPVLACFDRNSSLEHIVCNNGVGLFAGAGEAKKLADNVCVMYEDRDMCKKMGTKARQFILDNLTRKMCTDKICRLVEKAAIEGVEK